ncbi:putative short-chain dehydrogenase/reductase SDR, NAD(P)-binding domain superfamily [Plasmopara halstedii]
MTDAGVSNAELEACVATLQKLHEEEAFQQFQRLPQFKPLRAALIPLIADLRAKFFHGNSADSNETHQKRKRATKVERARQKALDRQFVNNTKLRAERLARLAVLQIQHPQLADVPDGVAMVDEPLIKNEVENEDKSARQLHYHRACYTCKIKFRALHHFYDRLCPSCAELNFKKRTQTADLRGHIAIVTGARVKIGYEITLKLLRSGAVVVATTRFPKDAAFRFAKEKDFEVWKGRLHIYGMDFRDLGVIDKFMNHIDSTYHRLDILINNATQTIRRPVHYYKHLLKCEVAPVPESMPEVNELLCGNAKLLDNACTGESVEKNSSKNANENISLFVDATPASVQLSQIPLIAEDEHSSETEALFPIGQVDNNQQQVDLRTSNSWTQKINQIETMELVEVFAINTMAPFLLNKRAIPLLEASSNTRRFIINVSAMEGKFYRSKTPNHPHTNMAKAAANMMTRTCGADLALKGIFMNSVDTGWINDENPRDAAVRIASSHNFQTPLDEIDAAARVLDPIFCLHEEGNTVEPIYGKFLKDYTISEW